MHRGLKNFTAMIAPLPWLAHYPPNMPTQVDVSALGSLVDLFEESFRKYPDRVAYKFMGHNITFGQTQALSRAFGAYLQAAGFEKGDRIALMMPNVPQYPVAVAGVLRAGCVVVNVNPLYTARELEHQLKDSGVTAIVILENFCATLQQVLTAVPLKKIIVTAVGDLLPKPKSWWINFAVRYLKKAVPHFSLPGSIRFNRTLAQGQGRTLNTPAISPDDMAVLQYTGGTTGVSKGAVLLHRNLVANVLQCEAWYQPALKKVPAQDPFVVVCVLPIYHIFGFNTNIMLSMRIGACNVLIANPRDITSVFKALRQQAFHSFPAVNTLFNALLHHAQFHTVNWRTMVLSIGGGMAVQSATAKLWLEKTGCPIVEGYGLSETSPTVCCNPVDSTHYTGDIGLPFPNTQVLLLDDAGQPVPQGQPGELAVRGPQVMAGYWGRPEETRQSMTPDGFFKTGDIAIMNSVGHFKIVDRKKDMILVSGFNVYPTEIEEVITQMPGVLECAAVGVPDAKSGEAVKLVVVRSNPNLSTADVQNFCAANMTGYKRPKVIEFRDSLPKTNVGKILRRELRDAPA
jgi:long-chain acyl-CoA synthetase